MKKRQIGSILILVLILIFPLNVSATQSRTGNFNKSFTLSGNQANDVCSVALAQYQRTGAMFGYTEGWCADFVSDCAILAGASSAIPASGGVSYLKQNILNAGGHVVSTPQVGDIAFMDWGGGGNYYHVEIVYAVSGSTVSTIGGNSGRNTSSNSTSEVWKHGPYAVNHKYFTCFVRPNYASIPKDTIKPTIEDVYVKDVSASGYTVHCIVRDDQALGYVRFPTWTVQNDQDDIIWGNPGDIAGKGWELNYRVNVSDHNNEVNCQYITHIYCYDAAGNVTACAAASVFVENIPPVISDVQITDISENGYTVSCVVNDEHSGVNRVQFPTWFGDDNPYAYDGSWHTSEFCKGKLINGRYTYRVNTGDYGNRLGKYTTHIYAWDGSGNQSEGYATETIITKAHKHEYISSIKKPATCTEPGIRIYTCKDNDDSYEEEIPATGHQHTELRNVKAATCAKEGYTGDTYCKDCNTKLSSGKSIAKKEHTWDSGKITTAVTCSKKGIKTYTCRGCNATRTEEIPATGHKHTELRNVKAATCAKEGYTGDTYCKDCNTKLSSGKSIAKKGHTWDSGKITTAATCSEKGIKTFTCTVCKSTRIEEISATGHVNKITKFAKETSCKSEGYTGDVYCKDCGRLLEEGKVLSKLNHSWDGGKVTKQPTTVEEGIKTYTCQNCSATKTETIAKLTLQTMTPGKTIKDKSTNGVYKVLTDGVSVEFTKPVYKKASVRIPDTIKVSGITCKVTGISANAFKNNMSLKSVSIGRNITVIGTYAFYGCKKLSKVSGGNGIVKIGHRAFANCSSLSKITIPGTVRSIGKQAFCNCKKLRSITIKTSTLSGKTVGSKAFAGTYKNPTVKVPTKQLKAYKKLLKARGMSSKAVYRK